MKNREVGVLYSEKYFQHSKLASEIAAYLRTIDKTATIQTHLLRYEQNWVESAKDLGVTLFVFLTMPPLRAKKRVSIARRASALGFNPEEEYMSKLNRKLTDVVVLVPSMPFSKADQRERQARNGTHYLDRFLHLDINLPYQWLAEAALALFTGELHTCHKCLLTFRKQALEIELYQSHSVTRLVSRVSWTGIVTESQLDPAYHRVCSYLWDYSLKYDTQQFCFSFRAFSDCVVIILYTKLKPNRAAILICSLNSMLIGGICCIHWKPH